MTAFPHFEELLRKRSFSESKSSRASQKGSQDSEILAPLVESSKVLRRWILEMLQEARSGHPGGSLSVIDLVAALYLYEMRHDPSRPDWQERDRLVLSKGHGVPAVYAAMALTGYFPVEELLTLRKTGARLQGHPDRVRLPGIEASTGSLGQGLSVAQGIALGHRLAGLASRTFCILGDGELQEGQVWEAVMSAPHFRLGHLVALVDYNKGQIDGYVKDVMSLESLEDKWRSFNWNVKVIDGHDYKQIVDALESTREGGEKPHCIIAHTVKGKGVSFMENRVEWHGVAPSKEQLEKALSELAVPETLGLRQWNRSKVGGK